MAVEREIEEVLLSIGRRLGVTDAQLALARQTLRGETDRVTYWCNLAHTVKPEEMGWREDVRDPLGSYVTLARIEESLALMGRAPHLRERFRRAMRTYPKPPVAEHQRWATAVQDARAALRQQHAARRNGK